MVTSHCIDDEWAHHSAKLSIGRFFTPLTRDAACAKLMDVIMH